MDIDSDHYMYCVYHGILELDMDWKAFFVNEKKAQ